MNICLISIEFTPFFGGGIGTYSEILATSMAREGHQVHVITSRWPNYAKQNLQGMLNSGDIPNLHIHRIPAFDQSYHPPENPDDSVKQHVWLTQCGGAMPYWGTLVNEKIEQLHALHPFHMIEFAESFADGHIYLRHRTLGLTEHKIPVTVTLHGPLFEVLESNRIPPFSEHYQRRITEENQAILDADCICSPSALLAQMVDKRLKLDRIQKQVHVVANPLVAPSTEPDSNTNNMPPYLLFVGRLEYRKGPTFFVRAAISVLPKHPGLVARIVGKDQHYDEQKRSMREYLQSLIPRNLQNRFIFEDNMPRDQVLKLYQHAQACIFPTPWDNYPYTCSEAMSLGGVVIANKNSGMAEMIEHEKSGLVVDIERVGELEAAIASVLTDEELVSTIRQNARGRILTLCDPKKIVRQKIALYQDTIEQFKKHENSKVAGAHPTIKGLLIVLFFADDPLALEESLRSIQAAAQNCRMRIDVRIVLAENTDLSDEQLTRFPALNLITIRGGELTKSKSDFFREQSKQAEEDFDFAMPLEAGDSLHSSFLEKFTRAFHENSNMGWLSCWCKSMTQFPFDNYCATDPAIPYDLVYFSNAPVSMFRLSILNRVTESFSPSEWNSQLHVIATMITAGYQCRTIPEHLAHFSPAGGRVMHTSPGFQTQKAIFDTLVVRPGFDAEIIGRFLWQYQLWFKQNAFVRKTETRTLFNLGIIRRLKETVLTINERLNDYRGYRNTKIVMKKMVPEKLKRIIRKIIYR